jgi:hypothetical protein
MQSGCSSHGGRPQTGARVRGAHTARKQICNVAAPLTEAGHRHERVCVVHIARGSKCKVAAPLTEGRPQDRQERVYVVHTARGSKCNVATPLTEAGHKTGARVRGAHSARKQIQRGCSSHGDLDSTGVAFTSKQRSKIQTPHDGRFHKQETPQEDTSASRVPLGTRLPPSEHNQAFCAASEAPCFVRRLLEPSRVE